MEGKGTLGTPSSKPNVFIVEAGPAQRGLIPVSVFAASTPAGNQKPLGGTNSAKPVLIKGIRIQFFYFPELPGGSAMSMETIFFVFKGVNSLTSAAYCTFLSFLIKNTMLWRCQFPHSMTNSKLMVGQGIIKSPFQLQGSSGRHGRKPAWTIHNVIQVSIGTKGASCPLLYAMASRSSGDGGAVSRGR